ncbi:MAG: glycosyltransferase [bacterium]|nr:glycosyltransferase [bacterium]
MNDAQLPQLSVVLPVFNEAGALAPLYQRLKPVLESLGRRYEIVFCDDGSRDGSREAIRELAAADSAVRAVFLRRNFGQTAAISAGVDCARGEIVVLMDADGQNDPADIPALLAKLDEGYDVVSGWRRRRRDPFFTKVLPSRIANRLIAWMTGVDLHDHGCTLKAYRREIISQLALYGEMHRFISIYGQWIGARTTEVEVSHHPRVSGRSKYSMAKTFKVLLDLPVLILLGSYLTRPMHLFGAAGLLSMAGGAVCAALVAAEKLTDPLAKAHRNPLLLMGVFFALVGVQFLMMGLLAELLIRVYHESSHRKTYSIAETINMENRDVQLDSTPN